VKCNEGRLNVSTARGHRCAFFIFWRGIAASSLSPFAINWGRAVADCYLYDRFATVEVPDAAVLIATYAPHVAGETPTYHATYVSLHGMADGWVTGPSRCEYACATGYSGTASAACPSHYAPFELSGCAPFSCTRPAGTAGYAIVAESDLTGSGFDVTVRARPGRLSGLSVPQRFPWQVGFVWRFCMGAQGA
jgi:hypothetical protein